MSQHYDVLVSGSGISGLTVSVLLAQAGKSVLLLEKSGRAGGCMQRFSRQGIPFDTGFHFSCAPDGCFGGMLRNLGILDCLEYSRIPVRFFFPETEKSWTLPDGRDAVCSYLQKSFPRSAAGIAAFFRKEKEIFDSTPMYNTRVLSFISENQDTQTLNEYLKTLVLEPEAEQMLSAFLSCHGTPSGEMPLQEHCRVSYGLADHLVRFRRGGDAFLDGLFRECRKYGVELRTNCMIAELCSPSRKSCTEAILTDGSRIYFDHCIMTMHPAEADRILPDSVKTEVFRERIREMQDTCGFFTVYGIADDVPGFEEGMTSCITGGDPSYLLTPEHPECRVTGIMRSIEADAKGKKHNTITIFQSMFPEETARWANTKTGHRGPEYEEWKIQKAEQIEKLLFQAHPEFRGVFRRLETASPLTCRDFLSPYGSAYGVRHHPDKLPMFGRLPIRNFYICGQSSLLPGVMGAMLSAFLIVRILTGRDFS